MAQSDVRTAFSKHSARLGSTPRVFLGLGSNLGNRSAHVSEAVLHLEEMGILTIQCSSLYETQPVEVTDQPDFINLASEVQTQLKAEILLETCLLVERKMGRLRREPKGPRIVDIDILFYGQEIWHSRQLSIPHPAIAQRRFVLVPMVEIAPDFQDPVSGFTMKSLLEHCPDHSSVRRLQTRPTDD